MPIKADSSLRAYYNEIDPFAAQWLRNLMAEGWITKGDVDERSIEDVRPKDLTGYDRVHMFAGIAGWDYALNQAGWRKSGVWTGSCPCQPFSAAGKGAGFDDERHLWPTWFRLIAQCRPGTIFGEQVASKAAEPWLDTLQTDLESMGYAVGAVAFPAAGIGAPHIRDRTYWVGDAAGAALERDAGSVPGAQAQVGSAGFVDGHFDERLEHAGASILRLADANGGQRDGIAVMRGNERDGEDAGRPQGIGGAAACGDVRWLGHADDARLEGLSGDDSEAERQGSDRPAAEAGVSVHTGPTNGEWADVDWLFCRDGKWRPVEPGTFPLAHGLPGRVGRLRAYGNAIVPPQAAIFIQATGLI